MSLQDKSAGLVFDQIYLDEEGQETLEDKDEEICTPLLSPFSVQNDFVYKRILNIRS